MAVVAAGFKGSICRGPSDQQPLWDPLGRLHIGATCDNHGGARHGINCNLYVLLVSATPCMSTGMSTQWPVLECEVEVTSFISIKDVETLTLSANAWSAR